MKRCFSCKIFKSLDLFSSDKPKRDGKSSYCIECKRRLENTYIATIKEKRTRQWRERKIRVAKEGYLKKFEYLRTHPCVDCGEADIRVLEFDHLRDKRNGIGEMIAMGLCWETVLTEIAKCEVVCCNCHRKRTAKQQDWFSYIAV